MSNAYGLHFPIVLDDVDYGKTPTTTHYGSPAKPGLEDSIKSSIRVILAWDINKRNNAAPFGSILEAMLGFPNAQVGKSTLETFLAKAIATWETRLTLNDVTITQENEYVVIQISGIINQTQTDFNYDIII